MEVKYFSKFVLFLIVLFFINSVHAHFVCGEVNDSVEMSSNWFSAKIFYPEYPKNYTTCEISPNGNKFCCDVDTISIKKWKIGDVVISEIFDNFTGYVAGPVSVKTTGEGYDVFPSMQLAKVINVKNYSKLIISNDSIIPISAEFIEPYNNITIEYQNKSEICSNCSSINLNLNTRYGMNKVNLAAKNQDRIFSKDLDYALVQYVNFNKSFECSSCKNGMVKENEIINLKFVINFSHEVKGLNFKEYISNDWEIVECNGDVKIFSSEYKIVEWNLSGKNIMFNCKIKSPNVVFFPVDYDFRSEIENLLLRNDFIRVFWLFPFFEYKVHYIKINKTRKSYSRVSDIRPISVRFHDSAALKRIALFTKETEKNVMFNIYKPANITKEGFDIIDYYVIDTDLLDNLISKIYYEIELENKTIDKYDGIGFYLVNGKNYDVLTKIDPDEILYKKEYATYKILSGPSKGIIILGKKKGFFNQIYELWF